VLTWWAGCGRHCRSHDVVPRLSFSYQWPCLCGAVSRVTVTVCGGCMCMPPAWGCGDGHTSGVRRCGVCSGHLACTSGPVVWPYNGFQSSVEIDLGRLTAWLARCNRHCHCITGRTSMNRWCERQKEKTASKRPLVDLPALSLTTAVVFFRRKQGICEGGGLDTSFGSPTERPVSSLPSPSTHPPFRP
jgi:hypothetical protein